MRHAKIVLYDLANNVYQQLKRQICLTSTILPVLVRFWSTGKGAMICPEHPLVNPLRRAEANIGEALSLGGPGPALAVLLHIPAVVAVKYGCPVSDCWPDSTVENILIKAFVQFGLH